jgi:hypothetical protein
MIAVDLVGTDFYWWVLEYPEACHRFLRRIVQAEFEAEDLVRKIDPRRAATCTVWRKIRSDPIAQNFQGVLHPLHRRVMGSQRSGGEIRARHPHVRRQRSPAPRPG